MNLHQANDIASRIDAFSNGANGVLPSNIEIRELVGFLRSIVPEEKFDSSVHSAVEAQPFRFNALLAEQIRSQLNIANEIVESNPKLKQKLLRTGIARSSSRTQGSETFVVLSTVLNGLLIVVMLWQLGGYWNWAAMLVAALIPVTIVIEMRKEPGSNGSAPGSLETPDAPSCNEAGSCDFGGGD